MLPPEQIDVLNQLLLQQNLQTQYYNPSFGSFADHPQPSELLANQFPTNCTHVQICYFIWNRQGGSAMDPTEIGRKYKEMYLAVF